MLEKGKKVGEYVLLEKLGAGGFGDVWKAEKRTALDVNYFALKFFRPKEDGVDFDKIGKELAVWKQLKGLPHIISVIELDRFEEYVYVVSDFADGGSLEKWLKNNDGKARTEAEAVQIVLEILTGLENLHDKGFVHRDLKPDNVLIMNGKFCLADFGVSREIKTQSKATGTAGTMEYMPPEAFAKTPSVTPQTDIWAIGVILQRLLTGKLPYPQDDQPSLIAAILMGEPDEMPDSISQALREIVKKALQKQRENRFQTAREMRQALKDPESFLASLPKPTSVSSSTIIDEDFDKTDVLQVEPTQDWRAIEAEKERQRQLAEAQRRQAEEEAKRIAALEAQRRQAELEEIQRKLAQNSNQSSSNLWKWAVGGLSGFVFLLLGIIGINSILDKPMVENPRNNPANRSANAASNKPAANTSSSRETLKNSIGMEFVKIPAGSFMMGSPTSEKDRNEDEGPQRRVTINYEFYMGKYEVTQEEYEEVMGTNPSNFKNCPRCPIEQVSWDDAKSFIQKLNAKNDGYEYRLPSEAEWEYAARGGTTTPFGIGNGNSLSSEQANFDGDYPYGNAPQGKYLGKTTPVGSYQPNAFGLYDMHGNVWEWVEDIWKDNYSGLSVDGSANVSVGDSSLRVLRGGSWNFVGLLLRSAFRNRYAPATRYSNFGFRLVLRPTSRP
jgi:formylglycine-generating enzyme required for sulfatase activity